MALKIRSDWHIHSEYSYDASMPLEKIAKAAEEYGFEKIGITDHVNYNDIEFLTDLKNSAEAVTEFQKQHPNVILGVELNPISKVKFDYIAKHGTRQGHVLPVQDEIFEIMLPVTKEELMARGVRYAIAAVHNRQDVAKVLRDPKDVAGNIKEWHRQQMFLATCQETTVLGHPWDHGGALWYEDFSVIPMSMHQELAAALKENGKYAECNGCFFRSQKTTEKFRNQYAEFLRYLFETGIPITFGSDTHSVYANGHEAAAPYLEKAGFADGDIGGIAEEDFWIP